MDATVQTLVTQFSNGEADLTESARIYIDVMTMLGTIPVLAQFSSTLAPVSGLVGMPANSIQLLIAFHNNVQLGELSIREANWLLSDWRETTGTPYNYVRDSINALQFLLAPQPTANDSQTITSYTTDTLPVWLQMPVTLLVLADEYQRESDHQNIELSEAYRTMGMLLITILVKGMKR